MSVVTEQEEEANFDENMIKLRMFSQVRTRHYELVDGVNILLLDKAVSNHPEFPQQIESLKRSGAFIIMHASENYDKFGRRLEDINDDLLVLTSYIVRHVCVT